MHGNFDMKAIEALATGDVKDIEKSAYYHDMQV